MTRIDKAQAVRIVRPRHFGYGGEEERPSVQKATQIIQQLVKSASLQAEQLKSAARDAESFWLSFDKSDFGLFRFSSVLVLRISLSKDMLCWCFSVLKASF